MDRTERKLKLVHSLGELQPLHHYTTDHGNTLTRPSRHKALLGGAIEIDVHSDEVRARSPRVTRDDPTRHVSRMTSPATCHA